MTKTIIIILLILFIVYNFPAVLFIDRNRAKKMTELGIKDKAEYIDSLIDEDIKKRETEKEIKSYNLNYITNHKIIVYKRSLLIILCCHI